MMSKSTKPYSISGPEVSLNDAQNFQILRKLGLDTIIESGSNIWTDYNEHDPGITLLEILTYALSDLAYRTAFPIEDILASQGLTPETLAQTQFYQAREILSVNPVSLIDFRKQISDVKGVANAWVTQASDPMDPAKGVLSITLDPEEKRLTDDQKTELVERVKKTYAEVRNLSQDLGSVSIRNPIELAFDLELAIDGDKDIKGEEIIARILLMLEQELSKAARFSTFEQAMTQHDNQVDKVFEGPALQHGFLNNDAMLPSLTDLSVTKLIPVLLKMPGMESIQRFRFRAVGPLPGMDPKWTHSQQFSSDFRLMLAPITRHTIVLTMQQRTVAWSPIQVQLEMKRLRVQERSPKLLAANRNISIPLGKSRDLLQYVPIQQDFPQIYGLPPQGLPPGASKERIAQKKQFQAYLMFFDQIMADYLAQLAHLGQLFSWSPAIQRTYFFQGLEQTFSGIEELLVPGLDSHPSRVEKVQKQEKKIIFAHYHKRLAQLREEPATFVERRNQFLDHLLARFGRELDVYVSSIVSADLPPSTETDILSYKIGIKQKVLESYVGLSAQRGKGPVMEPVDGPFGQKFSGLRKWVEVLLGMKEETLETFRFNDRFFLDHYHPENGEQNQVSEFRILREGGKDVNVMELMRIGTKRANYRIMYNNSPYLKEESSLIEDLTEYNISIYQEPGTEQPSSSVYRVEPVFKTAEEALNGIESVLTLIRKYDQTSERVYLLEHLLLRPLPVEVCLGLSLLDGAGNIWLQTDSWYSQSQLRQLQNPVETDFVFYTFETSGENYADPTLDSPVLTPLQFTFPGNSTQNPPNVSIQVSYTDGSGKISLKQPPATPSFDSQKEAEMFVYHWMSNMAAVGLTIAKISGRYHLLLSFFSDNSRKEYLSHKTCDTILEWQELLLRWKNGRSEIQWAITSQSNGNYALQLIYTCNSLELIFEQEQIYSDLASAKAAQATQAHALSQARNLRPDLKDYWQTYYQPWGWNEKHGISQLENTFPQYKAIFQDPYSHILTVVVPEWPSRFQEKGFKEALLNVLAQEAPSHLWLNVLWLDKQSLQQYQYLYGNWWRAYLAKDEGQSLHRKLLMEFVMERTIQTFD